MEDQNTSSHLSSQKSSRSWIGWWLISLIFTSMAILEWRVKTDTGGFYSTTILAFPIGYVMVAIIAARVKKVSWYIALIGDLDLRPGDEREVLLLQRSAQMTLALTIVLIMIMFGVIAVSLPSTRSIFPLTFSVIMFIRGLYGFIAWRLGLRT